MVSFSASVYALQDEPNPQTIMSYYGFKAEARRC